MLDLINLIDMDFGDLVTAMDDTKAFFFCIRMG